LKEFKSVKRVKELSMEELAAAVGNAKATLIKNYFDAPQPPPQVGDEGLTPE